MAWVFKYSGSYYNIAGRHIIAEILAWDYSGPILPLRIRSISISQQWDEYLSSVMGVGCEMTIVNEESDWNYYEELLVCEEQEFMLRVYIEADKLYIQNYILFEGFLITDIQEQQVLQWSDINLKASNYLQQLEEVDEMDCVNEASVHPIITYIGQALQATGLLYNIYVNCTLYETQMTNERLMEELFLHKHLFYEGEEEDAQLAYMNLQGILNTILKPFNMYVYSWNQKWYIERYSDLFAPDSNYEYNYRTYYVYDIATLAYSSTIQYNLPILTLASQHPDNFYTFKYVDTSQILEYGKGYKKVTVNCKTKKEHNLANEYFGNANTFSFYKNFPNPSIDIEKWAYDQNGMLDYGEDWVRFTPEPSASNKRWRGLSTNILLRGTEHGKITLDLSFRRQLTDVEVALMVGANERNWLADAKDMQFISRIQILLADPSHDSTIFHPHDYYYLKRDGDGWVFDEYNSISTGESSMDIELTAGSDEGLEGNTPHRTWKYDTEGKYYYWEYNLSVDLSLDIQPQHLFNVGEYSFDFFNYDLVLEIRLLSSYYHYKLRGAPDPPTKWLYDPMYRKIRITTSDVEEDDEDVEVEGEIAVDYFSEYVTDIDIYDQINHSAANTMWINRAILPTPFVAGEQQPVYSKYWLDARTGSESVTPRDLTLQEHLLEDIFQFLNKPRKKLKTTIRFDYHLPPFSFIRDENITRDGVPIDFLLLGYTLDVNTMQYEIEAEEFVADDDFRLIEGEMVDLTPPADEESDSEEEESSDGTAYDDIYYTDFTSQQILERGVYPNYVNFPTDITEWWVRYYNHFTLQYTNVQVGVGGVPAGKYVHILDSSILPAVGSSLNTPILVNEGRTYNGSSYHALDGSAMDEQIAVYFVTSIGHVFKIHWAGYPWVEYLNGQTDGIHTFWTDYAYYVHITQVLVVGD